MSGSFHLLIGCGSGQANPFTDSQSEERNIPLYFYVLALTAPPPMKIPCLPPPPLPSSP